MERFRRWRAKTFTGSDGFCQGDLTAAEPSSKSATNMTQQVCRLQTSPDCVTYLLAEGRVPVRPFVGAGQSCPNCCSCRNKAVQSRGNSRQEGRRGSGKAPEGVFKAAQCEGQGQGGVPSCTSSSSSAVASCWCTALHAACCNRLAALREEPQSPDFSSTASAAEQGYRSAQQN